MSIRKHYADTKLGQVHIREHGEGHPLVLLHQTPWHAVQYAKAQPLLAQRGFKTFAVDTPGYGLSDTPPHPPTITDYATAVADVMMSLGIDRYAVAGFHTGASIGAALAAAEPERVKAAALHGLPLYTAEESAQRLASPHWNQTLDADGGHLARRWSFINDVITKGGASPGSVQDSVLSFFTAGATEWYGHHAAFRFDMAGALKAIRCPTLLLSHTADSIHASAARARALRTDFVYHEFPGGTAHFTIDEAPAWSAAVGDFINAVW